MKFYTSIFILTLILFSACAKETHQNNPEEAAKFFFEELAKLDFEVAALYGTNKTKKSLNFIRTELKMSEPVEQIKLKNSLSLRFQTIKCTEVSGQTTCLLCCGTDSTEALVEMIQENKKWFVDWER